MPDDIFYWFLNMSIIGTLAGCVVMLIRVRIENILSYKKLTIAGAVAFAILAAAVIYTLITNSAVSLYNLT